MHIKLSIHMPEPGMVEPYDKHKSVEEEIRHCIDMIESGHNSVVEWKTINRFARELRTRKDDRSKNLLKMIEPTLAKYGIFGNHAGNDEA